VFYKIKHVIQMRMYRFLFQFICAKRELFRL